MSTTAARSASPGGEDRRGDIKLARRLRQIKDYTAPEAQQFADALNHLGVGTLVNFLNKNQLFDECHRKNLHGLPPPPPSWNYSQAKDIIVAAVEMAVWRFIKSRVQSWDPNGKASLETYFVRSCFFEFKDYYLRFCREQTPKNEYQTENVIDLQDRRSRRESVEDQFMQDEVVREAIKLVGDEQLATIIELICNNLSRKEVATTLGVSPSTINRKIQVIQARLTQNSSWRSTEGR